MLMPIFYKRRVFINHLIICQGQKTSHVNHIIDMLSCLYGTSSLLDCSNNLVLIAQFAFLSYQNSFYLPIIPKDLCRVSYWNAGHEGWDLLSSMNTNLRFFFLSYKRKIHVITLCQLMPALFRHMMR